MDSLYSSISDLASNHTIALTSIYEFFLHDKFSLCFYSCFLLMPLSLSLSLSLPSRHVYLDGMVDDQVRRTDGVDFFGISSETLHRVSHGSKVYYSWHSAVNVLSLSVNRNRINRILTVLTNQGFLYQISLTLSAPSFKKLHIAPAPRNFSNIAIF